MFDRLVEWPKKVWRPVTEKEINRRYAVEDGMLCGHRLPGSWPDVYPLAEAHKEIGSPQEFSVLDSGSIIRYRVSDK
jgi:hypothetical protein